MSKRSCRVRTVEPVLLRSSEQIDQQRRVTSLLKGSGDRNGERTMPAASAAVREERDSARLLGEFSVACSSTPAGISTALGRTSPATSQVCARPVPLGNLAVIPAKLEE